MGTMPIGLGPSWTGGWQGCLTSIGRHSTTRELIKRMLNMSELHPLGQGRAGGGTLVNERK